MSHDKNFTLRFLLIAAMAAGTMASDMYIPSLPAITLALHASPAAVKWTLSVYLLGFASLQMLYGPLSDRFGRKPILLLGFGIGISGSFLCALAPNIGMLWLGRLIQGMGVGANATLVRSIAQDLYHHDEEKLSRLLSSLAMIFSVAPMIAPVFGGYLQHYWGWHSVFIVFCVYLFSVGILIFFYLPETHSQLDHQALQFRKMTQLYGRMLRTPSFPIFVVLSSVSLGGVLAYYAISPFLYQVRLGLTAIEYGWLALLTAIVLLFSRYLNILLARRWLIPTRMMIGLVPLWLGPLLMMVLALLGYLSIPVILLPYMLFILASGIVMPNAMVSALSEFKESRGSAAGFYSTLQLLGVFSISAIASHLSNQTQLGLAILLFITGALAQGLYLFYRRHKPALGEFIHVTKSSD